MNTLVGHILSIETEGSLSLVKIKVGKHTLTSIVIDTPQTATFLKTGTQVKVLFKETEVVIGLDQNHAISIQNRLSGTIKKIEETTLLTKVLIETETETDLITSIITTDAVAQLKLVEGMAVQAMIKTNEIMLSE